MVYFKRQFNLFFPISIDFSLASQAIGVLRNLSVHMPIYPVGTKTMVKLIKLCQNAGGPVGSRRRGSARALRLDKKDNSTSPSWTNFLTTIVPGFRFIWKWSNCIWNKDQSSKSIHDITHLQMSQYGKFGEINDSMNSNQLGDRMCQMITHLLW